MDNDEQKTRLQRIRTKIENSYVLAWFLVAGICVISVSSFVEASAKLYANGKLFLPIEQRRVEFDAKTYDEILLAAKAIDALLLRLSDTSPEKRQFDPFKVDYENIEVELDNLFLRTSTRPLKNGFTPRTAITLLSKLHDLKEVHSKQNSLSQVFIEEYRRQAEEIFKAAAAAESGALNDTMVLPYW